MASNAEWSLGDHILMGNGATPVETFTRIPEVRNITFNRGTRDRVDVSSHESTPPFRDDISTFFSGGSITLDGNYLPSSVIQQAFEDLAESDVKTNFRVVITVDAGDVIWAGQGRVASFTPTMNFEDARRFTATINLTGFWDRVQGS